MQSVKDGINCKDGFHLGLVLLCKTGSANSLAIVSGKQILGM